MKILVAAEGSSLRSPIARQFEKAVWYLIIDTKRAERRLHQNIFPHDCLTILLKASRCHVSVILAGGVSQPTARLMLSLNLRLGVAAKMTVQEAIDRVAEDSLPLADLVEHAKLTVNRWPGPRLRGNIRLPSRFGSSTDATTPRGHHHLQQYCGRGH